LPWNPDPDYAEQSDSGKMRSTKSGFVFTPGQQKAPVKTGALRQLAVP
jgi:hypothetical protein